ncbi:hypothetical protein [Candidatus Magnetomonas plexicatena]|uniref:hypothetical protein n=1 Tax=Candidatus Magnetomonas plexicatena TaxID=2552947 RepID=UPI001103BE5C|nr:hypothetical protein E2O03_012865 [Nitrospirales bacterium LBB_01]
MLKILIIIAQTLIIFALWHIDAKAGATYNLPFLSTHTNAVSYCWLSNTTTSTATAAFTVMSNNSSTSPSQTANSTNIYVSGKQSVLLTFTGQTIQSGSTLVNIASDTSGSSISYGLKIEITGNSVTCESLGMSCFQGTTNPRRNLAGYTCNDGNHYGF